MASLILLVEDCLIGMKKSISHLSIRDIGYIFQDLRLFSHLSVKDNITFGGLKQNNYDEIIDLMGIHELLHKNIRSLSGGESQKVSIARALLKNPKFYLLMSLFMLSTNNIVIN